MTSALQNKVAIVAGGTSGIGLEIVRQLCAHGYRVGFFGSSTPNINAVCDGDQLSIEEDRLFGSAVDVRQSTDIFAFFEEVKKKWGTVSAFVYCAGISPKVDGQRTPLHMIDLKEWNDVLAVNLTGALICCKSALPDMIAQQYGRIVMIGSIAARTLPHLAGASYVASKSGLAGLTRSLAMEYGGQGIIANTIAPGNIATKMTGGEDSLQNKAALARIPSNRMGLPADIAHMAAFLCSEQAEFINGATIDVTGGEYMTS